jgi:EmrB/QacA subfamily drug resistance transporter
MATSFLAAMEATVVSTAMPTVVASLGGIERFSWVFTAYMLTSTVLLPIWGKLADLYGRRRVLIGSIVSFLLGSALAGLARSIDQLIVFRALQGLGAGGLVPLGMTVIGDLYTPTQRARMQATLSSVWGFASLLGPLVGGLLTDQWSWRWVFFINLPIGALAVLLIQLAMRRKEPVPQERSIDVIGAMTLCAAATFFLVALTEWGANGLAGRLWIPAAFLIALVLALLFLAIERRATDPLIPLSLVSHRRIRWPLACAAFAGMAMFGTVSFIPMFAQGVLHTTATGAGMTLAPFIFLWVVTSIVAGRLVTNYSVRRLVVTGFAIVLVGFVILSQLDARSSLLVLRLDMAILGCGMGLSMLCLLLIIQTVAPRRQLGIATSLNVFARSLGGVVGVAILGAVLAATLRGEAAAGRFDIEQANALLLGGPESSTTTTTVLAEGLHRLFLASGILAAINVVIATRLPSRSLSQLEAEHRLTPAALETPAIAS